MALFTLTLIFSSPLLHFYPVGLSGKTQRKLKHVPFNTVIPNPHGQIACSEKYLSLH